MAIISLGIINKSLIPMLAGCAFCFLNRLLNQYDGTLLFKNIILTNINISSSKLLGIIPYIVSLKFNNSVRQKSSLITSSYTTEIQKINVSRVNYYIFFYQPLFFSLIRCSM